MCLGGDNMKAELLINARKNKGLTQKEIAKKARISRSFYTKIESNKRRPGPQVASRIGLALGMTKSEIINIFFDDIGYDMSPESSPPTLGPTGTEAAI
jgi:transcriptional regulator with XRE-family HTH domain